MKTTKPTTRTFRGITAIALSLAALGLSQPAVQATTIVWSATATAMNTDGVAANAFAKLIPGTVVDAKYVWFGGGEDPGIPSMANQTVNDTLNGRSITFTAVAGSPHGGYGNPSNTGVTQFDGGVLKGGVQGNVGGVPTFSISNLEIGKEYNLQLFFIAPSNQTQAFSADGGTNWSPNYQVDDSKAWFATGTFTADATSMTITPGPGNWGTSSPQTRQNWNAFMVTVPAHSADAGTSTVTASPATVSSDGDTTSTITVTLKDAGSAPVGGKTVTLAKASGSGSPTIDTISGTTNGSGIATFTVKCATAGSYTFEATDTTDTVTVAEKAGVTFSASAVSRANSTVVASDASVLADGFATSTITVTLKNATSAGVSGKTVSLAKASGPGTPVIAPASATTDEFGVATFTVTSTTVGSCIFAATDVTDSLAITATATVDFTPLGVVEDANSTVEASPAIVPADGTTASTITVTLKDPYGNPVPDKAVSLATTSGPVIDPASTTTDASGVATFAVTSTTAGDYVFTATETTDNPDVVLTQTATVTFGPSAVDSTVAASPSSVTADGTPSTITVTLLDAGLNPVPNKVVALTRTSGPGSPVIDPASATTNSYGVATFSVSSTTAGSDVFTATDTTDGITIGTAGVTFEAGPVYADQSTVVASPASVTANGTATSTITVTLKDTYGNPVAGKDVSLASDRDPADTISAASGPSIASGVVTFTVTSTTPGSPVFTATDTTDDITIGTAGMTFTQPPATITWSATATAMNTDGIAANAFAKLIPGTVVDAKYVWFGGGEDPGIPSMANQTVNDTLNGRSITFTAVAGSPHGGYGNPSNTGVAQFDGGVLKGGVQGNQGGVPTFSISNLEIGKEYNLQLFFMAPSSQTQAFSADGTNWSPNYQVDDSKAWFATGTFTANATSMTITPGPGGWGENSPDTRQNWNAFMVTVVGTTHTLTYIEGSGGTITGTKVQTVAGGADGTEVTAVANAGYHFVKWSDNNSTVAARKDLAVTADITATAIFAKDTHTLTYIEGSGGTITGTEIQTVNDGADGTEVTAVPNAGYHFVEWSDNNSTVAARTDLAVTADITTTAIFAKDTYADWARAHGFDPDHPEYVGKDGLRNLLIYALNLKTDGTNGSPGTLTGRTISFAKRTDAVTNGDVTYAIEISTDLGVSDPWTPVTITSPDVDNDTTISYTLPEGVLGGKIFARLVVTQTQ